MPRLASFATSGAQPGPRQWAVVVVAAVVGLLVGSFLNVVVYRAPLGLSISSPRSFCPTCDRQLAWWENVPLLSWLALRGRCHGCHEAISVRYPLVESATAVAFALVAWAWHGSALSAGYCVLAATAIAVGLIEFGGLRAPLWVGASGAGLGELLVAVAAIWLELWPVLAWSLVGLVVGTVVFGALRGLDPDAEDARWHGRTLLPVAGCWLGGIGGTGSAAGLLAGLAAWLLTEATCLAVVWADRRAGSGRTGWAASLRQVASVPLASGALVALVVSLWVAG